MLMRRQKLLLAALLINLLVMLYLAVQQHQYISSNGNERLSDKLVEQHSEPAPYTPESVAGRVTILLREFESFDNAIVETIKALYETLNGTRVLVVGDSLPYPPLELEKEWNVEVVSLKPDLLHNYSSSRPVHLIRTKYVLVLPDGASLKHWNHVQKGLGMLGGTGKTKAVVLGVGMDLLRCMSLDVDLKRWTLSFAETNGSPDYCDFYFGDHAFLMLTDSFKSLADPFARPFSTALYVQAKLRQWKVRYLRRFQLSRIKQLFTDPHNKWKHKQLEKERQAKFFRHWGIKAVVHPNGKTDYHGCTKTTSRCFPSIVDSMPDFLYEGRWTPPCCLKALRETAKYVFSLLEEENVRYWLEGGSLLGAARNGDIIPWDYDIDIGIYKDDIQKSSFLKDALQQNFVDDQGFVWEKDLDGDFFRVQFSEQNHQHVDIWPFYSRNGTMTKNTWFKTHRQDTEFPEHFLTPLTKIQFAGIEASAPNNIRQFLEFKFGQGVIEQPRFPNFKKVQ